VSLEKLLIDLIIDFVTNSESNRFSSDSEERIWDKPLVGFSKGDDPYYHFFKKDIGDFYLTPDEFFYKAIEGSNADGNILSVVSWVLPQSAKTRHDNKIEQYYPSERWVKARLTGDDFNKKLSGHIVSELEQKGIRAVAPMTSSIFEFKRSDKYGYASNWSERHAAFVSGLGTFGLCDGLITAVGKAMRCGSVIIESVITPTSRQYKEYNEYCLYFSKGICMKCADRCPAGAINQHGHNKDKCREYQRNTIAPFTSKEYNLESTCCGLCQVGVPCENCIPRRLT